MAIHSNKDIGRAFGLYAELLLLHGKEERFADLLSGAAYRIRRMEEKVVDLTGKDLAALFRPQIVAAVHQVRQHGAIEELDELVQLTPSGLFDMMRIKGLGGKKLAVIWTTAKIDTVEDLLNACKKHVLSKLPGFGAKTERNIISAIESLNANTNHFHYADVADIAIELQQVVAKLFKTDQVDLCGGVRRQATTVEKVELVTCIPSYRFKADQLKRYLLIDKRERDVTIGHTPDEIPVAVYHCKTADFGIQQFKLTGSEAHVKKVLAKVKSRAKLPDEQAIYKAAGMPFIEPELREDIAEWEYSKNPSPLITIEDITGVVHNHTNWSDGVDKLESFAAACKKRGYEYVVISDHSQNAHYAGGLKPDKVLRQFEEIDRLNEHLRPFRIFKSIECDICVSGDLDYDAGLLRQFDLVIISIHQLLKMNEDKATARLIKAIENPFTTILGHMTGRQLLIRPGYPVDFKKVIDACAANGVVIEINANPYRLDMDWSHIPYALSKGVMISINPDAHSIREIDNIRWGVSAARKGGLTKEMTWNAMNVSKIEQWIKNKRPGTW